MTKALALRSSISTSIAQVLGGIQVQRALTLEEVNRAREAAIAQEDPALRILVDLLWFTAARISEALEIRVQDIDVVAGVIQVPTLKQQQQTEAPAEKNGKPAAPKRPPTRGIPVPEAFLMPLIVWIHSQKLGHSDRIIPWRRTQAWEHVHRLLLSIGVDAERARPHAFRHGHALHAIHSGVPANVVQQTLGHSTLLTTQVYVRAAGTDIRRAYRGIDWT